MTYTIKYNKSTNHIAGITERTTGSELSYAVSACPALSRSGSRMAVGPSFEDISDALSAARVSAKANRRNVCRTCEGAAESLRVDDENKPIDLTAASIMFGKLLS